MTPLLEDGRARGLHPGAQLVVRQHGLSLFETAVGEAHAGSALTPRSVLLWMSAGKPLLAAGLAVLKDLGMLQWDDPVVRFVPEFGAHGKDALTLRHLLNHTGGFRQADSIREVDWPTHIAAVCATRLEPNWEPGVKTGYHIGGSWTILGAVLERITGDRLGPWLRQHLFLPLGMADTWLGLPDGAESGLADRLSRMHQCADGRCQPHPFWSEDRHLRACWPGSNTFSTASDMAVFYDAFLQEGQGILHPETVRELTTGPELPRMDQTFKRPMRFHLGFLFDSKQPGESWHSYGYGRRASPLTFGHGGNQCSVAFADPARQLVVALAFNGMPGDLLHQQRLRDLLDALDAG